MIKIANDGPRTMRCWLVKTPTSTEVVSAEYARDEDEVYMFLDDSCAGDSDNPEGYEQRILKMRNQRGIFCQLRAGENYHGPFRNLKQASRFVYENL